MISSFEWPRFVEVCVEAYLGDEEFSNVEVGGEFLGNTPSHHWNNDLNHFVVEGNIQYDFLSHLVVLKHGSMNWRAQNLKFLGDIPIHH
ncbi:hypothetical protein AHAS_Ahas20G0177200 [Arachis hypogaea]